MEEKNHCSCPYCVENFSAHIENNRIVGVTRD